MKPLPSEQRGPKSILILTGSIGAGHVSVARVLKKSLEAAGPEGLRVDVADLLTTLKNIATTAAKKIYLGSLKLSPKIYDLFYGHAAASAWTLKFLNAVTAPFLKKRLLALLRAKKPTLLVSTYPLWHHLIKKIWERYSRAEFGSVRPFASVVTDSISIHECWTHGDPDFYFVANEDTASAMEARGVPRARIHVLGYAVSPRFEKLPPRAEALSEMRFSEGRTTLVLILSAGMRWSRIRRFLEAIRTLRLRNLQLLVIATSPRWRKRIERMKFRFPARVQGWTENMPRAFAAADIVLTKAGGAIVMECIAAEKPLIVLEALPGQENGNALFVEKYRLGVVLHGDFTRLQEAVRTVQRERALMQKNLRARQKKGAAKSIAEFLLSLS